MSTITVSSPQAARGQATAEGDVTGAPSSEMSERAELESIIELLSPIILPDGQLYCHLRADGQKGGQVVRLDDKRAKNMVIYLVRSQTRQASTTASPAAGCHFIGPWTSLVRAPAACQKRTCFCNRCHCTRARKLVWVR